MRHREAASTPPRFGAVKKPLAFIVTCEHGGNRVPRAYASLFEGRRRLLESHRGYDRGALAMARALAKTLAAPLVASTVSRLVIELNRSPRHRDLYSPIMRKASEALRRDAFRRHYMPYCTAVERTVSRAVARGQRVVHLSSHSFTPVRAGVVRRTDVGLLHDPRRPLEQRLCSRWQLALRTVAPRWRVRRNDPYRGTGDGLTRYLRTRFADSEYAGIELEVNQKHIRRGRRAWAATQAKVVAALRVALEAPL